MVDKASEGVAAAAARFDPLAEPWVPVASLAECIEAERPTIEEEEVPDATTEDVIAAALVRIVEALTLQNAILTRINARLDSPITMICSTYRS